MVSFMRLITTIFIIFTIVLITSACGETKSINIQGAWARPGFRGDNSAVYLTIVNPTDQGDGLIGADSDIAGGTEIHLSKMDASGTMTMERQDLVGIPAKSSIELAPGGLHIMLVNLGRDLPVGDTFLLTLQFQRAGDITFEIGVKQLE